MTSHISSPDVQRSNTVVQPQAIQYGDSVIS